MSFAGFDENFSLMGKNALITGAASGIGLEIAELYARKGADIIAFDIEKSRELEEYVHNQGRKYYGIQCDIADTQDTRTAVSKVEKEFGNIDILVNCAGVGLIAPAEDMTEEMWDKTMSVNIRGLFFLTQCVGRNMIKNGGGKIISIASQAGIVGMDQHVAYGVSKAGIIYMTKLLAFEWSKYNIRSNAISPTIVLTPLGERVWNNEKGDNFKKNIPAGRFAYPQEIAACAVFLASGAADMINGENLVIDGGFTIQ